MPTEIRNAQGIRRYKTEIMNIQPANDDTVIQTTTPERMDKLAQEFYGDSSLWWLIASLNSIKGTYVIPSNTIIRIPKRERINSYIEQLNATR